MDRRLSAIYEEIFLDGPFDLPAGRWILIDEDRDEWAFFSLTSFRRHGEPAKKVID